MPRRRIGQLGFMDAAVAGRAWRGTGGLDEIHRLADWPAFDRLLSGIHAAARGEASYPPLMMFKVLLLQRWHALSDPAMEEQLYDRLSFQRFCGLSLEDRTPDHTTIWRFREALVEAGLIEPLLAELARQLDAGGLLVKQGTLIDASLVKSAARRPRLDEGKTSPVDADARFGIANERRRFTFGYKMHVAVDQGSALVRGALVTPANVQEIEVAPDLVPEEAGTVYADRGYDSERFRTGLVARGAGVGVMRRGRSGQPLSAEAIARNHALSLIRRPVEAVFGTLKRSYGLSRMPYFNAARNAAAVVLALIAFNLRRWRTLAAGRVCPQPA